MNFKAFKALVENQTNHKIKCIRSYNGGEFTSNEFNEFCEIHGIKRRFSTTKDPRQNRVVERKNRTVQEVARTMLNEEKFVMAIGEKQYIQLSMYKTEDNSE